MLLLTSSLKNVKDYLHKKENILTLCCQPDEREIDIQNEFQILEPRFTHHCIVGNTFINDGRWSHYTTAILGATTKHLPILLDKLRRNHYLPRLQALMQDKVKTLIVYGPALQIVAETVLLLGSAKHVYINDHSRSQGVDLHSPGLNLLPISLFPDIDLDTKPNILQTLRSLSSRKPIVGISSKGYYIVGFPNPQRRKRDCTLSLFKEGAIHKLASLPDYFGKPARSQNEEIT